MVRVEGVTRNAGRMPRKAGSVGGGRQEEFLQVLMKGEARRGRLTGVNKFCAAVLR